MCNDSIKVLVTCANNLKELVKLQLRLIVITYIPNPPSKPPMSNSPHTHTTYTAILIQSNPIKPTQFRVSQPPALNFPFSSLSPMLCYNVS